MPKKPLPQFVPPMQAFSVKEPFDSPEWIFETKLDGYRAIAVIDATGRARLWSRNHLPLEPKFPTIQDAVRQLKLCSTILDDEIVALGGCWGAMEQNAELRILLQIRSAIKSGVMHFCGARCPADQTLCGRDLLRIILPSFSLLASRW
jgi:hypothetical protein